MVEAVEAVGAITVAGVVASVVPTRPVIRGRFAVRSTVRTRRGPSGMRANGPSRTNSEDWPRYTVKCTRGAEAAGLDGVFDDDEVVLFDPTRKGSGHWLSATARTAVRVDENL